MFCCDKCFFFTFDKFKMDFYRFTSFLIIMLQSSRLCYTTHSKQITMSNIGVYNTRRLGVILRVMNYTGFLMCARYCEQCEECDGFNYLKSHLLCELLDASSSTNVTVSEWRFVDNLSWLQDLDLSTHLRSSSCTSSGKNIQMTISSEYCLRLYFPIDCGDDATIPSHSISGVYRIESLRNFYVDVFCDLETDGGGWTVSTCQTVVWRQVIQRRQDGSVDFFRGWDDYKNGFGSVYGEYWIGNVPLHRMLSAYTYSLRIDMEHFDGTTTYAEYSTFHVAGEDQKYRLTIGGYSGDAGDALSPHNGMLFSTYDNDNDNWSGTDNCAYSYKGAWWYNACHSSNLNGLYYHTSVCDFGKGINWQTQGRHEYTISLKSVVMKIRVV